jgi:starvation-inducible outer membrane lipoprotein
MILNTPLSIEMLVNAIAIVLIGCISVPAAIAQPTAPSSETPAPQPPPEQPPVTEQPQQNSYVGFGGVIGIQGGTTSLSQGTFAILLKFPQPTSKLTFYTSQYKRFR